MRDLTPELCDRFGDALRVMTPGMQCYGGKVVFSGQVTTIKAFEDNSLVREAVAQPGNNRVLVVDGGASLRRAMLGDMLAAKAVENGWQAIVINGCIRDREEIGDMDLAVYALGTHPMKTDKLGVGQRDVPIEIQGIQLNPGDYLAGDRNGLVASVEPLVID